jgi:hypothetical protein
MRAENPISRLLLDQLDESGTRRLHDLVASIDTVIPMLDEMSVESMLAVTAADWMHEFEALCLHALDVSSEQFLHLFALAENEGVMPGREVLQSLAASLNKGDAP